MISMPAGIIPAAIISATDWAVASMLIKSASKTQMDSGVFRIFRVISVAIPKVPSDPTNTPVKS